MRENKITTTLEEDFQSIGVEIGKTKPVVGEALGSDYATIGLIANMEGLLEKAKTIEEVESITSALEDLKVVEGDTELYHAIEAFTEHVIAARSKVNISENFKFHQEDIENLTDGDNVTHELFSRIEKMSLDTLSEEDIQELLNSLKEKTLPDNDESLKLRAEKVVRKLIEASATRIRRFKTGRTSKKASFQCPQGFRAQKSSKGGRPRCVPSFRAAGGMGALNKQKRKKKKWARTGAGAMSQRKTLRVKKRRHENVSPLAIELAALTEGFDLNNINIREEVVGRIVNIYTFLNEEFMDDSVTEVYDGILESLLEGFEAGRLDEDVVDDDEFIEQLSGALQVVTKSATKLDEAALGNF